MPLGILGKKLGQTRIYDARGVSTPVTIVHVGPNRVLQVKTQQSDGYNAVQLGLYEQKEHRVAKPLLGHFKKLGTPAYKKVKEFRDFSKEVKTGETVNADLFTVGDFIDAIPAIIIVGTILQPLAQAVNMHPVHFAIIGIVSLAFGLVTPPYGLCLMIACAVAKIRLVDAIKDTMIMLVPMLLVLAAIIVFPQIPLFLPRLFPPGTL